MSRLSIIGADHLVRPPRDGAPYLRMTEAAGVGAGPGSVSCDDGRIAALDADPAAEVRIDARAATVLPGLVDCHTHLPFAGWRADEYAMKVAGASYEEIARAGGGIRSSSRALAGADDASVLSQAEAVAAEMLACGATRIELKSGYGLAIEAEERQLRLAAALAARVPQRTTVTALVAHSVPPDHTAGEWLDEVERALPRLLAAADVTALDVYVESVAFDNDALARVGDWARAHGLHLRAHVEQFACHRSVPVALEHRARSVDHLACLHPDDLGPLARSECAAVLLPGAEVMGAERCPPARALADAGAICALATDCNPGTSPISSLPLIIGLAVRRYGWTPEEAIVAATLNAAWAAGVSDRAGSVEVGKDADLVLIDSPPAHVPYRLGRSPVEIVVIAGRIVFVRPGSEWRIAHG